QAWRYKSAQGLTCGSMAARSTPVVAWGSGGRLTRGASAGAGAGAGGEAQLTSAQPRSAPLSSFARRPVISMVPAQLSQLPGAEHVAKLLLGPVADARTHHPSLLLLDHDPHLRGLGLCPGQHVFEIRDQAGRRAAADHAHVALVDRHAEQFVAATDRD